MKNRKLVLLSLSLAILLVLMGISLASAAVARKAAVTCGSSPYPSASSYPSPYPLCQFLPLVKR